MAAMTENVDPVKTLKAFLTEHLHIDLKTNPVNVKMDKGALVIEGFVENIAQKKRALYSAMGLGGVTGVMDRLKVRPSRKMTDVEIKQHLLDAFEGEPTLKPLGLNVDVNGGVVDIEGTAGSLSHKRLAGVLAWWVPGSTDVINSIEVSPSEDDNDAEVKDAVFLALEKDGLVDATAISVAVRDFAVSLAGVVKSHAEKEAAEDDAWYVWGVNDVKNGITVRRG